MFVFSLCRTFLVLLHVVLLGTWCFRNDLQNLAGPRRHLVFRSACSAVFSVDFVVAKAFGFAIDSYSFARKPFLSSTGDVWGSQIISMWSCFSVDCRLTLPTGVALLNPSFSALPCERQSLATVVEFNVDLSLAIPSYLIRAYQP
jgi:hypothetical protein